MFLTPSSYKVSTRLPYFAGNGKSPETAEPAEPSAPSTNHPGTGDTFQPTRQALPTILKTAKSTLTHLLETEAPSSEAPGEGSQQAQPSTSIRFTEESAENSKKSKKASKFPPIRTTVPPGTRMPHKQKVAPSSTSLLRAASTLAASSRQHEQEAPPEVKADGNVPLEIWQAMEDELPNPSGLPMILVTPHIAHRDESPHSSLILPSRTYSRISTRPSSAKDDQSVSLAPSIHENEHYLSGDSDLNSEDRELFLDEDSGSDEGSAIYDDEQIIETREARKKAKSEKGVGTYSSAAPSVISDIRQNPHYLPGDSDLDSEDLELYHDIDDESSDDAESEYKSSVGKSANIPIAKPKASKSDLFPIKSPEEVKQQAEAFQMAQTLGKGQLSQTLQEGGRPKLISSYQQQTAFEKLKGEATGAQQITQAEQEKIKKICNKYTLEKLRFFQKDLGDRLKRWQHDAEQVAMQLSPDEVKHIRLAEIQTHNFELDARQAQINFQLGQLSSGSINRTQRDALNQALESVSHEKTVLAERRKKWQADEKRMAQEEKLSLVEVQMRDLELDAKQTQINFQLEQLSSGSINRTQRDALIQASEAAIQEKTALDGPLEAFKPITIGMDQTRLNMRQVNEAIVLKLRHQLNGVPKDADERIQLTQNLSKTFTTPELGAALRHFKGKQAEAVHTHSILQDIVTNDDPQQLIRNLRKQQAEASQEMILLSKLNREQPTNASDSQKISERINNLRLQQQKASTGLSLVTAYLTEKPSKQQLEHKIKFSQAQQHYINDRLAVLEKAISFQTVK
ncbi:MAG: hypothetical protein K0Q50_768 [Vampirovibrio sp.]|jgi:hypothetical protein|nr:hypothetical protein [Vampirovibrio sp.]